MTDNQLSIDNVLHMIKDRQITSEEGFKLIKNIQHQDSDNIEESVNRPITYFQPMWEESALPPAQSMSERILLFDTNLVHWNMFNSLGIKTVLVKPGKRYEYLGEDVYEIAPDIETDYNKLIHDLKQSDKFPNRIIHLWSDERFIPDIDSIHIQLRQGIYSLFYLSRALIEHQVEGPIKLLYVYETNGESQPQFAGVSGFARTIRKENLHFIYKTIQLDGPIGSSLSLLLNEFDLEDEEVEVCYQGGKRLLKKVRQITGEGIKGNLLRTKGVYLITGGFGGIGYIFSKYLAEKVKAKLVITGRSELSSENMQKVRELEKLGSEVLYIKVDISNRGDVNRLVTQARIQFNEIHAVIHAAGVLRDSFISKKLVGQIEDVIAPKLHGTIWLDEETRSDNLDFFIMFSSVMSVLGNAGQSDYTYANAFMDNYATKRDSLREKGERTGKTVSINWPLWKEGGMKVDESTLVFMENTLGILPISNENGIQAFEHALTVDTNQLVVMRESGQKKNLFHSDQGQRTNNSPNLALQINEEALYEYICMNVKKITSEILYVDTHKIDIDADKSEFGFDSISTTDFINRINKKFNLELTPPVFYEHPNIGSFVFFLKDNFKKNIVPLFFGSTNTINDGKEETEDCIHTIEMGCKMKDIAAPNGDPIAIIGVSCNFPQSDNLDELWRNLNLERNLITEIPLDRWNWRDYYGDPVKESNKTNVKWGGFMKEIDKFDAHFFGISPHEAELMDPRQRIYLETVWKVIEDAGYNPSDLSGTNTGLFVGVGSSDYNDLIIQSDIELQAHTPTGLFNSILTNRISYLLNFHGPSEPIDTACSSSLVAVHRAVETIRNGECDLAIAGGINILASPNLYIALGKAKMLSEDGKCKTFDKNANGYVRGEGSAALLLKPLSKAQEDGDNIYAVIKGTAVNHGGRANSLTAPNPNAQADLIVDAWTKSALDPSTVSYIEVHGSGTPLGDPIEINGLKKAFSKLYKEWGKSNVEKAHCGIGTIKTNIGHLESAAGIAGLIKVLLCMKHGKLVKSLHYEELNPYIELKDSPFYIVNETKDWERSKEDTARRAGVSSFGFGGVNAHVVVEEYQRVLYKSGINEQPQVILLSARNEKQLNEYLRKLVDFVEMTDASMAEVAYTLQISREGMDERIAIIVNSLQDLKDKLNLYLQGKTDIENLYQDNVKQSSSTIGYLVEGEEGKEFIGKLIERKNLNKLAQLWVIGIEIKWEAIHAPLKPNRISLPTYPFARERYWIPQAKSSRQVTNSALLSTIHPLLHENTSNLTELRFSSRFTGKEIFFAKHIVNGYKVMPGVAHLEMARRAVEKVAGIGEQDKVTIRLKNVIWTSAISVDEEPIEVHIGIYPDEDDEIAYEIYGDHGDNGESIQYSHGYAVLTKSKQIQNLNIPALQLDCQQRYVTSAECYEALEKMGLAYDKVHKGIESVHVGAEQVLARVSLPSCMGEAQRHYILNPILMDAVLQSSLVLPMGSHYEDRAPAKPTYPHSMKELEVFSSCTRTMWARIRYSEGCTAEDQAKSLNIDICDEEGKVCIRMKGLTFLMVKGGLNND